MSDIIALQFYLYFYDEYHHLSLFPLAMRVLYKYKSIICFLTGEVGGLVFPSMQTKESAETLRSRTVIQS